MARENEILDDNLNLSSDSCVDTEHNNGLNSRIDNKSTQYNRSTSAKPLPETSINTGSSVDLSGKLKIENISAVIIMRDAQRSIAATLASLRVFREVIVYDNGSSDDSIKIAQSFANVTVIEGQFLGFGATKNRAASYASNDLIFSLDADERVTPELLEEIALWQYRWHGQWVGQLARLNYFLDKPVRFGDWRGDYVLRLYDRREHQFSNRSVHESIQLREGYSGVKRLTNMLEHDTVYSLSQTIQKMDHYTELNSIDSGFKRTHGNHPGLCLLRAAFAFIRCYLLRLGFLDGWRGLLVAYGASITVFYKYAKVFVRHEMRSAAKLAAASAADESLLTVEQSKRSAGSQ